LIFGDLILFRALEIECRIFIVPLKDKNLHFQVKTFPRGSIKRDAIIGQALPLPLLKNIQPPLQNITFFCEISDLYGL